MKRGMAREELVKVILVLVAFAIFALFLSVLIVKLANVSDVERCRTSVIAKYVAKKASLLGTESPIELSCYTRNVNIKSNGVYVNGKLEREFKGDSLEYNVLKALGDEMVSCWYQLNEGKINFFGDFNNDVRCVICADIEFEQGIGQKMGYAGAKDLDFLIGLNYFLEYETIKKGENERTYNDYLSDSRISDGEVLEENPIDLQGRYAVIFETSKSDKLIQSISFGFLGGAKQPGQFYPPEPSFGGTSTLETYYVSRLAAKRGAGKFYSLAKPTQLRLPFSNLPPEEITKTPTRLSNFLSRYGSKEAAQTGLDSFVKTLPKGSRIAAGISKAGGKAIPIVGWAATIGLFAYDLLKEGQPELMAIELVPMKQVSGICGQLG